MIQTYDWDMIVVDEGSYTSLTFSINLCVGWFPCSLYLTGNQMGKLVVSDNGGISCQSNLGCIGVKISSMLLECSSTMSRALSLISVQGSILNISNSTISGCSAITDGAAIRAYDQAVVSINLSVFNDLHSLGYGGALSAYGSSLFVSKSSFNNCSSALGGGAIWSSGFQSCYGTPENVTTNAFIESSSFEHCSSKGPGGAVLSTSDTSRSLPALDHVEGSLGVYVGRSVFFGCFSVADGGALSISGELVSVDVVDSEFASSRSSGSGGALAVKNGATASISKSVLKFNIADYFGGGMFATSYASISLSGTEILANTAGKSGGAVSSSEGTSIAVFNSTFTFNSAVGLGGGAIHLQRAAFLLHDTHFYGNSAPSGGGGSILWQNSVFPAKVSCPQGLDTFNSSCGLFPPQQRCSWRTCKCITSKIDEQNSSLATSVYCTSKSATLMSEAGNGLDGGNCGAQNSAMYGSCIASDFEQLKIINLKKTNLFTSPGLFTELLVAKLDSYNQTILSDSESFLQVLSSRGQSRDQDPSTIFIGTTSAVLKSGIASFSFAVQPIILNFSFIEDIVNLQSQPFLFFRGSDIQSNGQLMQSEILTVVFGRGSLICPSGYVLTFKQEAAGSKSGVCTYCSSGTYSINSLAPKTGSLTGQPECIACPDGGDCQSGGANISFDVGIWVLQNFTYFLVSCPDGYQLVNSSAGTSSGIFSPSSQQCKPCQPGQYIINPNRDECQMCPSGMNVIVYNWFSSFLLAVDKEYDRSGLF